MRKKGCQYIGRRREVEVKTRRGRMGERRGEEEEERGGGNDTGKEDDLREVKGPGPVFPKGLRLK